MASRIDPDSVKKPARPAALPAAAKPGAPPAKPPAARPAPPKPAGPPPKAVPAAAGTAAAETPPDDDQDPSLANEAVKQAPAWAISMLVHIVALLAMALMVSEPPKTDKPRVITSSGPEVEEEFTEFEDDLPDQAVETSDPTAEVAVTTEVAVTPVEVVSNADDLEAAPLAVEFTDFGTETAPASDMMAQMGAVGGTAGGLGGRAQASKLAKAGGGGGDTEQAVDRALKWIAAHQMPDGGWSFDLTQCPNCKGQCSHAGTAKGPDRCAATAMALLPFLGRGYTHREGPFKPTVEKGITFLAGMAIQGKGKAYGAGGSLYSQGLAGIALSECYGMTQDNRLAAPTQLVLNFIMSAQDPRGGGWKYQPRQPGDTSVVGWQLMALKSGNMAYLQVNPLTIKKAVDFLDSVQSDSGAAYGYTDNSRKSPSLTAVGLLCRMYLGWKKDHPALQNGVKALAKLGPTNNLYYSYYATQIMHHMEGDVWISWNDKMKKLLLPAQSTTGHEAGSWFEGLTGGGHGPEAAGRLYITSLATMMLEVYYRHLPIYRNQVVEEEFRE